jgi:hypothetical protein
MKAALIYSGYLRTAEQCLPQQDEMIKGAELVMFHRNETTHNLEHYRYDDFLYNENKAPETSVRNTLNQWYNNFMAFSMVNPEDADVFVRIRYDIKLTCEVDLSQYQYNDHTIYIAHGHDYRHGVNDQFAFGNYNVMKQYYSVYLQHERLFNEGHQFHTESYVKLNLKGIEIKRIEASTDLIR